MWRFEDFTLDTARFELRRGDDPIRVEPQVFDVLSHLVTNHDRCVSKQELFDTVWRGRFVGEAALTSRIKAARRAMGDDGESQRLIRTVRGRGYQSVGTIDAGPADAGRVAAPAPRQHIAFCYARDGVRLAYGVTGEGPPLVRAANWMTHLGYDIESPVWRHWVRDLAARRTFIRYDERGCGLSDWDAADFTFEDWVNDLDTIVQSVGLERFPLLGVSQGGAVAVAYAARNPERVSHLILCGAYARGRAVRAMSDQESGRRHWTSTLRGWDGEVTTRRFARCSRRNSCPTARVRTGRRSTTCNAAPRRRRTPSDSSSSSPASTSATSRDPSRARR
ncbi:hypothetical protein MARA_06500 [Mycolicibacterium arabiense]|uniref:OmpR/PhoB-type domain-containing protein n=1 Tax=Mycolicibacterium arabiense TaxID=1286181 RepID=A0A7I7RRK6_9MYCO|nr:hypothetical protein MARA_06500 [Mycolicibacterium arabiense]